MGAQVEFSGRVITEPETRKTRQNTPVTTVIVATKPMRKNEVTGEWEPPENPVFLRICGFGLRAQVMAADLTKGAKIAGRGRLEQSRWQDEEGRKHQRDYVVLTDLPAGEQVTDDDAAEEEPAPYDIADLLSPSWEA